MKRRICSRRFIGSRRRLPGRLGAWQGFQEIRPQAIALGDGETPSPGSGPRRGFRFRVALAMVALAIVASLTVALRTPATSANPRFPDARFTTPPLDHLIAWDSFSEVEQTKGVLAGLGLQAIAEIRRHYLQSRVDPKDAPIPSAPRATLDPALFTAIDRVRQRLEEFQGTEQTHFFEGELLRLLRRGGFQEAWLDLYLQLIYRQPTSSLIDMEGTHAVEAARATGRDAELQEALAHWNRIPPKYRSAPVASPPGTSGPHPR